MSKTKKQKETMVREWIFSLGNDEPGEWSMEQEDMDLIREALQVWLKTANDYKPSIQVVIDGIPFEVR